MKKAAISKRPGRITPKQRAILTFLDELQQTDQRRDQALWKKFDEDLRTNRLGLRLPSHG